jgi:hypothetical protein
MNNVSRLSILSVLLLIIPMLSWGASPGPKISEFVGDNKHNLSSLHPRTSGYKASSSDPRGSQICIFCHIPHGGLSQNSLWSRELPTATFGHYSSQSLVISTKVAADYDEPKGSAKLCLSCHDGVTAGGVALGKILPIGTTPIPMAYGDKITGDALFTADKIKRGHHPVSFIYDNTVLGLIQSVKGSSSYRLPLLSQVKMDSQHRMQCTTCHNPHQNQSTEEELLGKKIAPFWVYGGGGSGTAIDHHDAVCNDCHLIKETGL